MGLGEGRVRLGKAGFDGLCVGPGGFAGQRANERVPAHGGRASACWHHAEARLDHVRAAPAGLAAPGLAYYGLIPAPRPFPAPRPPLPAPPPPPHPPRLPSPDPAP